MDENKKNVENDKVTGKPSRARAPKNPVAGNKAPAVKSKKSSPTDDSVAASQVREDALSAAEERQPEEEAEKLSRMETAKTQKKPDKGAPDAAGAADIAAVLTAKDPAQTGGNSPNSAVAAKDAQEKKQVWSKKTARVQAEETELKKKEIAQQEGKPTAPGAVHAQGAAGFTKGPLWQTWLRPVAVLSIICLITSLLLAVTNYFTMPYIDANIEATAVQTRMELLPAADGFEDITPDPLPANITSVYRATNDAGYVIEAYGKGYGGDVPAMVAFDAQGNIAGVKFPENDETPGLGKNLTTKADFSAQFVGLPASETIEYGDIDALTGATLSSNAALTAINAACQYYYVQLSGGSLQYEIPDEVRQQLVPSSQDWQTLDVTAPGVAGAYLAGDGTYIIVGQANGIHTVSAVVAMDENGTILNLYVDTSGETEGLGKEIGEDSAYTGQYVGLTSTDAVDTIAGATVTTQAIADAVQAALDALPLAKEAV